MKNKYSDEYDNKQIELEGQKNETEERIVNYTSKTQELTLVKDKLNNM